MALRPILKMGDARLLQRAAEVIRFGTPELIALAADMEDTMRVLGGVGLAAPQIGVGLRVIVFGFDPASDPGGCDSDADSIPFTVLINPALTPVSDETEEGWEGCLSIPGLRGLVPRRRHLRYEGFDLYGQRVGRMAEGFHARVVQHETDHLDGVLYPMRMRDVSRFGFTDVLFPNEKEPPDR